MKKVFLSYAHGDAPSVQSLESALRAQGVTVWRDQRSLYGGQQWPKAIGEALASHDLCLLLWSRHADASHFIEFEWTTAIALRRPLPPCLLDDAPSPRDSRASTASTAKISARPCPGCFEPSQAARPQGPLRPTAPRPSPDWAPSGPKTPGSCPARPKRSMTRRDRACRALSTRPPGTSISPSNRPPDQAKAQSKLEPWVKVVGLTATLLAIAVSLVTLSDTIKERFFPHVQTTPLRGLVQTMAKEPVAGAIVKIDSLPHRSATTSDGGSISPTSPGSRTTG